MLKERYIPEKDNKSLVTKNCIYITECISEINNTQVNNVKDISVVWPM